MKYEILEQDIQQINEILFSINIGVRESSALNKIFRQRPILVKEEKENKK